MLVQGKNRSWIRLLFRFRGSALVRVRYRLLCVFIVSLGLTLTSRLGWWQLELPLSALSLVGLVLGIFLGFRNNTSYDRFWEGRKQWGLLVNCSRSLSRQIVTFLPGEEQGPYAADFRPSAAQSELVLLVVAFVHALRMHLRDGVQVAALSSYLDSKTSSKVSRDHNIPNALLAELGHRFAEEFRKGNIGENRFVALEDRLNDLSDIQGACERIKNTPIPLSYSILIHRIVALYVFALPLGLVTRVQLATPFVVLAVAYTFLGLDSLGDELEDPFGLDMNDLPLTTLSTMIEVNLRETLCQEEVPAFLEPVNGVLS